ncbi:MGLL [Symbiodinium necroappetens]|uniref:MGLL protein n=1 Tax=Symbiodinium necroappetens TaxID=1628268 RepID=A0A813AH94_9DINO|nr:MGLL [Symbiodinium necroappetens]
MGLCCSRTKLPPHLAVKYSAACPPINGDDLQDSEQLQQSCEFNRSFDNSLWLFSRAWQPREKSVWATLMIVHGTVDHSGVYAELGEFLAMQGVAVFASDMRGWGRSDGEALYVDNIDSFMGDILSDYQRIHSSGSPYANVTSRFLLGKSIGGLFAAWTAAQHRGKWTGLIGLSGAFQIDPSVKPSAAALALVRAIASCAPKLGLKPPFDPKLIVSDSGALEAWERDPLVSRGKLTAGYILEMLRLQEILPDQLTHLSIPVLMLWGTGDKVVTEAGHTLVLEASKSPASQFLRYQSGFHNLLAEPKLKETVTFDMDVDQAIWPSRKLRGVAHVKSLCQPLVPSADTDEPLEARQDFCGKIFIELWSEDPDGFPMPDGCYYSEDDTDPTMIVKQLHILFSERNHLKKNTRYMAVTNMNVLGELRFDFPADGAVWVWSMDDAFNNPFGVIEKGAAYPAPETRVPPRDTLGDPQFSQVGDPRFHDEGAIPRGLRILGTNGALIEEMLTFCIPHDEKNPSVSPSIDNQCKVCFSEEECGNGGNGVPPDPSLSFCRSPIDLKCSQANGNLLNVPAFAFELTAKLGYPITPQSILRLWLHPLTQWNIGPSCQVGFFAGGCTPPVPGGTCSSPICQPESVVGGTVVGIASWPINTLRIILPNIMAEITDTITMAMEIGNLPLPAGGFFPSVVTAEITKDDGFAPDYWDIPKALAVATVQGGSARLYKKPQILAASLVSKVGDGNQAPFKADSANRIYARLVFGTTFYGFGNLVEINFKLPVGYACSTTQQGGSVPDLELLANMFPSTKGRLGGKLTEVRYRNIPATPDVMCQLTLLADMIVYARTVYFIELVVDNPTAALKRDDPTNTWSVGVVHGGFNPAEIIEDKALSAQQLSFCPAPRQTLFCLEDLGNDYAGSLSVLGKLSDFFIAPSQYGVGQLNALSVFFMTEQEVGSLTSVETEIWVDAPSGFDFGMYCSAAPLDSIYYIPEGRGTSPLPTGDLIPCVGAPTSESELTYNRAKLSTTGRLLRQTFYGFQVQVQNAAIYVRTQLDEWRLWTYVKATGYGVDGTYETARVNERVPAGPDTSWGMYLQSMPAENFQVAFSTSRPTVSGVPPADITVLPIIASFPTTRAIRVTAPAGYEWDFDQVDFRYQAPGVGVNPLNVVDGAEADIPISGKPARPNSEPKNVLTMDYMQLPWTPGVIYGFACKIRIPMVPPTGSANQFTIEFGYNEDLLTNRLEAGTAAAPVVQRLINGAITYTTSIMNLPVDITFTLRTVTNIPEGGGLVIIGPPNFVFQQFCQPKPASSSPELPYDSTCLYAQITATGQPRISIIAGPEGIPGMTYKFALAATNPPQAVPLDQAGIWTLLSYSLISEEIVLDQNTTIPGYAVARPMVSAGLVMHPRVDCTFTTLEERAIDATLPETFCDFEHWQFYPPRGYRDDRPNRPTQLIFKMQLGTQVDVTSVMTVRAPEGYVFDAECRVVTKPSSRIFNDSAVDGVLPSVPANVPLDPGLPYTVRGYAQRYNTWPDAVDTQSCLGRENEARITWTAGLALFNTYLFRLSVLRSPPVTPEYNYFLLEYNGEASDPFPGIDIWAFMNTTIIPTTTAASRSDYQTPNEVTIQLRPVNAVPNGGHLRVTAPSGFLVPTVCVMSLRVHESEMPNISAFAPGPERAQLLQWAEFLPSHLVCQGDQTPSSRGRLLLTQDMKYLRKGVLYVLTLEVSNPQTTSATPEDWHVQSYEDLTVNNIIDESYIPGFIINTAVQSFAYLAPESTNALIKHRLDFNMSFPDIVAIGDRLQIVAPVSYMFSEPGDRRCPQYVFLDGAMTKTVPSCSANTINWHLMDESIPAQSPVRFMVQVQNPPQTPVINLFQVRQMDANGTVKTSRMISGYEIVPELVNPMVRQDPAIFPCRIDVNLVTGLPCEGTGSFSAVVISFTASRSAELVSMQAHVNGESYDFTNARFGDGIDGPIVVYGRDEKIVVVEMMVHNGVQASITVHNVRNPMTPGISKWSVTTYVKGPIPGVPTTTTVMPVVACSTTGGVCGMFPQAEARRDEKFQPQLAVSLNPHATSARFGVLTATRRGSR